MDGRPGFCQPNPPHAPRQHARQRRAVARGVVLAVPPPGDPERGLWSDDVPVPTFGPRMVCTHCGVIGADARPNWREQPARLSGAGTVTGIVGATAAGKGTKVPDAKKPVT
jgi:hypothetical protein